MEAKELRIGNYIKSPFGTETVFELIDNTERGKINQKGYEYIVNTKENRNQYKPIEINPIPLTEQWLINFGFKKRIDREFYIILNDAGTKYLQILVVNNCFYPSIHELREMAGGDDNVVSLDEILYVHQLQNLYFALTEIRRHLKYNDSMDLDKFNELTGGLEV